MLIDGRSYLAQRDALLNCKMTHVQWQKDIWQLQHTQIYPTQPCSRCPNHPTYEPHTNAGAQFIAEGTESVHQLTSKDYIMAAVSYDGIQELARRQAYLQKVQKLMQENDFDAPSFVHPLIREAERRRGHSLCPKQL